MAFSLIKDPPRIFLFLLLILFSLHALSRGSTSTSARTGVRLVFHIGPPKTASTSLQERLCTARHELTRHGVHLFAPASDAHLCPKGASAIALELRGETTEATARGLNGSLASLLNAIEQLPKRDRNGTDVPTRALFVSSETLVVPTARQLGPLVAAVNHARGNGQRELVVVIVIVHRRFASRQLSGYAHQVANKHDFGGRKLAPSNRLYTDFLGAWLAAFPRAELHIVSLEGTIANADVGGFPDPAAPILASTLGIHLKPLSSVAGAASGKEKSPKGANTSILGVRNATFAAFLEWMMLNTLHSNATEVWTAKGRARRRQCAARRAVEALHGTLPLKCDDVLAIEARKRDSEDVSFFTNLKKTMGSRVAFINFPPPNERDAALGLPPVVDGSEDPYCEVDRDAVMKDLESFRPLLNATIGKVVASCWNE